MKSTGEAIGYDDKFHRALFKAMIASGIKMQNYGTIIVTLADEDKQEALPLVKRFYEMGFNIEATIGTSVFLCENNIIRESYFARERLPRTGKRDMPQENVNRMTTGM